MTADPGFDPYLVLGVGVDADELVIQLAYRARIREVHPDLAGAAGLERAGGAFAGLFGTDSHEA